MTSSSQRPPNNNRNGRASSSRGRTNSRQFHNSNSRYLGSNSNSTGGSSSWRSSERSSARSDEYRERTVAAGPSNMVHRYPRTPQSHADYGGRGTRTELECNFFELSVNPNLRVSQYSVRIKMLKLPPKSGDHSTHERDVNNGRERNQSSSSSQTPAGSAQSQSSHSIEKVWTGISHISSIDYNRNVFDLFVTKNLRSEGVRLAYDGRSIAYAPGEIPRSYLGTDYKFNVDLDGREVPHNKLGSKECRVRIEHTKDFDLRTLLQAESTNLQNGECIAALDIALSCAAREKSYIQVGKSFYTPNQGRSNIPSNPWKGFYQSVRLTRRGLAVNVDESHTTFWNKGGQFLKELVRTVYRGSFSYRSTTSTLREVASKLMHVKVQAQHSRIVYKVHGFKAINPFEAMFEWETAKKRVTIAEYFSQHYHIDLKDKESPLVITNIKKGTLVPMEVLKVVPNQRLTGILSPSQIQSMVRLANIKPIQRRANAIKTVKEFNRESNPICEAFNITVGKDPIKVDARILQVPSIQYGGNKRVTPERGAWKRRGSKCLKKGVLDAWMILVEKDVGTSFTQWLLPEFVKTAERFGISVRNNHPAIKLFGNNDLVNIMKRGALELTKQEKSGCSSFMLIILKEQNTESYNKIKHTADLELGIPTQVISKAKVLGCGERGYGQYFSNLILKVNTKLGGQSSSISHNFKGGCFSKPHIILGADVTHPSTNGKGCSIAALVGSRDREGVQYSSSIRAQYGGQEIISDLGSMFKEVYSIWREDLGNDAQSIFMFRDGVSESQFQAVMEQEAESLKIACRQLSINPKLTYIIVTKRHHTRFFKPDGNGNISPGTVIEKEITSKNVNEFYLNSHAGILGTNKPSKYTVLIDENKLKADDLQQFIFQLTHGFVRCDRSVSMVNCVFYAHLLAYRARIYLREDGLDVPSNSSGASSSTERSTVIRCARDLQKILYYC